MKSTKSFYPRLAAVIVKGSSSLQLCWPSLTSFRLTKIHHQELRYVSFAPDPSQINSASALPQLHLHPPHIPPHFSRVSSFRTRVNGFIVLSSRTRLHLLLSSLIED